MSPFNIDVDPTTSEALQEGITLGSAIRLPFEVPYFFVVNGDRKMQAVGGALLFGGWACDRDSLTEAGAYWNPPLLDPPSYMYASDYYTNTGKSIPSFLSRSVIIALMGTRVSWYIKSPDGQTRRYKDYVPGARRHAQFLVYIADKTAEKKLVPWGPAVLTASGFQVGYILKGLQDWKSAVEKILRAEKSNATPWMFYTSVGTFGDEFKQEMVGPAGTQHPITPIGVQVPKNMGTDLLEKLYVGREIAKHMAELKNEAREWLDAWNNLQPGVEQAEAPAVTPPQQTFNHYPPPPPNWPTGTDDDIPF